MRKQSISLKLGWSGDDYGYALDLGLPNRDAETTHFARDPEIKTENLWIGETLRPSSLCAVRHGPGVRVRSSDGVWHAVFQNLAAVDSIPTC